MTKEFYEREKQIAYALEAIAEQLEELNRNLERMLEDELGSL